MKDNNIDFLILYEHKVRELENACLLLWLLRAKGYSVKIECIYSFLRFKYRPRVLIVPHLYDDKQVFDFITKYGSRKCSVVNLQYEQILSEGNNSYSIPSGQAKKSVIFCWGKSEENRCNSVGQNNIKVGNISFDFNNLIFKNYFISKDEIKRKYSIKTEKILLFISSFSFANYNDDFINKYCSSNRDSAFFLRDISNKSQKKIIDWLCEIADRFPDYTIVYRPHPAETLNSVLDVFSKYNKRIKIVKEYSIRQWIFIADSIYTWYSTSIFDVFYSGKYCGILRPFEFPASQDIKEMYLAPKITSIEQFIEDLELGDDRRFPIPSEIIEQEYGPKTLKAYRYIEELEKIYKNGDYYCTWERNERKSIIYMIGTFGRGILFDISKYMDVSIVYKLLLKNRPNILRSALLSQQELYRVDKLVKDYLNSLSKVDFYKDKIL